MNNDESYTLTLFELVSLMSACCGEYTYCDECGNGTKASGCVDIELGIAITALITNMTFDIASAPEQSQKVIPPFLVIVNDRRI